MTKQKNSNCDKLQELKLLQNSNSDKTKKKMHRDKTQTQIVINSKTFIVIKLKLKWWRNKETEILKKLKNLVYDKSQFLTKLKKNHLVRTPQQLVRCILVSLLESFNFFLSNPRLNKATFFKKSLRPHFNCQFFPWLTWLFPTLKWGMLCPGEMSVVVWSPNTSIYISLTKT